MHDKHFLLLVGLPTNNNPQWLGEKTMAHEQQTLPARFLMGNMYLKSIHLPRDDVSDVFFQISETNQTEYRSLGMQRLEDRKVLRGRDRLGGM